MKRFLVIRIIHATLTVIAISIAVFVLLRVAGGDPARLVLGPLAPPSAVAALRQELGLDAPIPEQYGAWVGGLVRGDFGDSISRRTSVSSLIGPRVMPSALLIAYSLVLSVAIGIPLGIFAAVRRNRLGDQLVRLAATVALAMPAFWVGLLLILLFSLELGIFPLAGYGEGFGEHLVRLTLPSVTVSFLVAPLIIRTVRASMLETLSSEFVEAAEARGLAPTRILYKHALRNAIIPTITLLGVIIGYLLSWTVVVENVFAIPGLGSLLISSVQSRDYPVIEVVAVLFGVVVVIASLVTDLAYAAIDPRVRL
ncbi:MAG TPA: ABC transporter permease [Solirubrobacterales bacterium]|nr:ABC transporter permease [Solirubrobacterales bacterium]